MRTYVRAYYKRAYTTGRPGKRVFSNAASLINLESLSDKIQNRGRHFTQYLDLYTRGIFRYYELSSRILSKLINKYEILLLLFLLRRELCCFVAERICDNERKPPCVYASCARVPYVFVTFGYPYISLRYVLRSE